METVYSVLVVDDEPDNFDVIETLLHDTGYVLNYASSGQKAFDRLETFQPDVILLDVMMPDLNGIEVCRQLKNNPRWKVIPVIIVTSLSSKEDLAQCMAAGADDFVSKPVNGLELRARVHSMLRIKQQYDDLQILLQAREDMVGMMVHDLRNPLTSVLLATDMLRSPNLTTEQRINKIEQLEIAGLQLRSLIDSLLLMAKLESGKMVLNRTDVDIFTVCSAAIAGFEAIAAQKSLKLIQTLPEKGGSLSVDATVFRRVIDNLLSNAVKFSPRNGKITLQAEYLSTGGAKIQVADCGPGIKPDLKQCIFEKYEIGTLVQDASQIGLGLAFCKMAIEAHDGKIFVEDNEPKGTIFTILIPIENHQS
ncbi:MAG: hybrid sensor histidine kinase/response regulator [Scytolyngbya sp. HA4215-MV1]|nr:hybrid sensor histidine kinase/response regulator [Scytolyngbya sp. HA4215-MV1]